MTFAKAIKILDLLDHDKEIVVKIKNDSDCCDWDGFSTVDRFSKYDEISNYIKYFTLWKMIIFVAMKKLRMIKLFIDYMEE